MSWPNSTAAWERRGAWQAGLGQCEMGGGVGLHSWVGAHWAHGHLNDSGLLLTPTTRPAPSIWRPKPSALEPAAPSCSRPSPVVASSLSGYLGKKRYSSNRLCTMQANTSCSRPRVLFLKPLSTCGGGRRRARCTSVHAAGGWQHAHQRGASQTAQLTNQAGPPPPEQQRRGPPPPTHLHQAVHRDVSGVHALEVGVGLLLCGAGRRQRGWGGVRGKCSMACVRQGGAHSTSGCCLHDAMGATLAGQGRRCPSPAVHCPSTHAPMSGAKASSEDESPTTAASCGCACTAAACTCLNCCSVSLGSRPALAASTRRNTSSVDSLRLMRPAAGEPTPGSASDVAAVCRAGRGAVEREAERYWLTVQ